jgi:hypothetical protein
LNFIFLKKIGTGYAVLSWQACLDWKKRRKINRGKNDGKKAFRLDPHRPDPSLFRDPDLQPGRHGSR